MKERDGWERRSRYVTEEFTNDSFGPLRRFGWRHEFAPQGEAAMNGWYCFLGAAVVWQCLEAFSLLLIIVIFLNVIEFFIMIIV